MCDTGLADIHRVRAGVKNRSESDVGGVHSCLGLVVVH
jgi:hypothetical protein